MANPDKNLIYYIFKFKSDKEANEFFSDIEGNNQEKILNKLYEIYKRGIKKL